MNEERTASEGGPYKAEGSECPGTKVVRAISCR